MACVPGTTGVDRKALGAAVLGNPEALAKLEEAVRAIPLMQIPFLLYGAPLGGIWLFMVHVHQRRV
jgi:hypothetical protein